MVDSPFCVTPVAKESNYAAAASNAYRKPLAAGPEGEVAAGHRRRRRFAVAGSVSTRPEIPI